MALRCPECGGRCLIYEDGLSDEKKMPTIYHCPTCGGTGWRIPPTFPQKVTERMWRNGRTDVFVDERRERMNHENRTAM